MASKKKKIPTPTKEELSLQVSSLEHQLGLATNTIKTRDGQITDLRATVITLTKRVEEQDVLLRKKPWWRVW